MLHAGNAGIVSRSLASSAKMMAVKVKVCGLFGLTVAEKKDGDHGSASAGSYNGNVRDRGGGPQVSTNMHICLPLGRHHQRWRPDRRDPGAKWARMVAHQVVQ